MNTPIVTTTDLVALAERRREVLNPPPPEATIWRYYPLDKFLTLATTGQLFFAPATSFQDPFEGDYGNVAKARIRERYGEFQYERDFNTYEFLRPHTYVSCWHEAEHESDAMWKLYGNSIAVKSTFSQIASTLNWSKTEIRHCGRVNYVDYSTDDIDVDASYLPYFYKRKSFLHEREVRFVIQEHRFDWTAYPKPLPGKVVLLDLAKDLAEIVISPAIPTYVANAIHKVISALDLSLPVNRSSLTAKPAW